ncbi:MAG: PDZ domain-containing protein [Vescimonas sp.]
MKMSNSSLSEEEATVEGLGFALPISSVSFVVNDLIAHGEFLGTPTIGITVRTIEKSGGGTQVEVYTVDDALGAAEAGVQPGDIILEADGQPVSVTSDLLTVRRSSLRGRYHPSDHPAGRPVPDGGRGPVRQQITPAPHGAAPARCGALLSRRNL